MAYSDIDKPSDYFNTVLYTGDGTSSNAITGVGFQPDWVWIKVRSTTGGHRLVDAVRGATKFLVANATNAEGTDATQVASLDSDGFTVGSDSATNLNSATFASWNWLASNSTASNTDGSITSTVSANTTSGFSIVSYTGTGSAATVGHGLGATPQVVIVKERPNTGEWMVYHSSVITAGASNKSYLYLNTTDAILSNGGDTTFTETSSSVFGVGTDTRMNQSSQTYIAYCFAEKKGFSKFGSYTGNGSSDGTFVYTGFKPAFVLAKSSSNSSTFWYMYDNKRNGYNVDNDALYANDTGTGQPGDTIDILSNGFKFRANDTNVNSSGFTYIYMAFAENPFVTSTGIPACAR